ncbi:ATP-dependent endonuclease of the OLD family-like protein [Bradyrhizobium sp. ORS 375]|uniref:ATP-dependent nuclease n=1 Tax=Bradyrhizobium sp. (strain ORS 375) TaxID=566679 RepID=UPI00024096A1|nr:ATP-dependent endonuclease [Bradyrhizobium sp. ORS 375]CCD93946.1 ATP-dependent endonuclease of the OLD family-like protein [Bradyrhizobium sp. ORS 375]
MRLERICIRNFRLLRRFSIDLARNKTTTVLVGPNNSGKTSVMEALQLFVGAGGEPRRRFSIHDFAHVRRKDFAHIESKLTAIGSEEDAIKLLRRFAPSIRMELKFRYADETADLVVANELLMSLEVTSDVIAVRIEYAIDNARGLWVDFKARTDKTQTLFEFLAGNLQLYYKVKTYKISEDGSKAQALDSNEVLNRLIKIDTISAQRHLDDEEATGAAKLSRLLHDHYNRYYKVEHAEGAKDIEDAIKSSSETLTGKYVGAFGRLTGRLKTFGYPQGHASPDLLIKAEMTAEKIYRDSTRIYYASEHTSIGGVVTKYELPEKYNGLGYKNLIFIVLQLESFRAALESMPKDKPRVHIIALEEPEAHLHPQMQSVFIREISRALEHTDGVTAQVILSTHSSHMVSGSDFDPIRYFKRKGHEVSVKDLSALPLGKDDGTVLNFLRRYMKSTHCELFFADKAIFVEGQVERLLLPLMIEKFASKKAGSFLASQYISISEVGGAYAHIFKPLIDFLGVPTLLITDLDSVDDDGKKCPVADGKSTSNAALKSWLPGKSVLTDLMSCDAPAKTEGRVQVSYQVEENGSCGRSFEEAFVYANVDWLKSNHTSLLASGKLFDEVATKDLVASAYQLCARLPKVDFALDLVAHGGWDIPKYISDGLEWLAQQGS